MAILINTDNFIGNRYRISAREWTQCPGVHFQACLFFSRPMADIWKLLKKYVCSQDREKCSNKYYFCSFVLFRALYSTLHSQTYRKYLLFRIILKKKKKSSWQLSANYLPDLRQAKWVLLCVYQPFLIESSV